MHLQCTLNIQNVNVNLMLYIYFVQLYFTKEENI